MADSFEILTSLHSGDALYTPAPSTPPPPPRAATQYESLNPLLKLYWRRDDTQTKILKFLAEVSELDGSK